MKKIIVGFSALLLLITAHSALAAGWNQYPSDCQPPLAIGNYTTGDGIRNGSSGCWTKTNVTMQPGQVINVSVYYDNTTGTDAQNVTIRLNQSPSGSMLNANSNYTFSGDLTSANAGSLSLGSVSANISSSQTVTYAQAKWFRKGSSSGISLPGGQTGYEAFNGGLNLGTIPNGDWGSVILSFNVGTQSNQTCQDPSASNYGGSLPCNYNQNVCSIYSFTANGSTNTTVSPGSGVTLYWSTNGFTSVNVSGPNFFSSNLNGSQTVYPTTSGTYTLTAYGNGNCGSQTRTVYINVNNVIITPPPVVNACAVTTIATNVTRNTATLNGLITGSGSTGYFEYGTTTAMGQKTSIRTLGPGPFTEIVTGLAPNSIYYFRLVVNCGGGISYGAIQTLSTLGAVVTTTNTTTVRPVIQGTTVIGTQSPIMLTIENRYEYIGVGDLIDYVVTYRNIGSTILTRPVLQVVVPKGIVITNASRGTYSLETNTLTVELEDLLPGAGGVVYLQGHVDLLAVGNAQIVTTAILVYTSPSGSQENAIAYALNRPKDVAVVSNNLGALAFLSGIFPSTLLGWLFLILIILAIVLLSRRYYTHKTVVMQPPHGPMNH